MERKEIEEALNELATIETTIFGEGGDVQKYVYHIVEYSLNSHSAYYKTLIKGEEVYRGTGLGQAIDRYFKPRRRG